ncbi:toll/interleukin-1 receptor domain-containing protein [Cupriavidus gilardii]|uniref:toll/interleukin-1 receptor domain-containing protein n=1 Tax=Cupriavidus gilardii TaxID=82541 RepID=UPI001EE6214A|nr:toll/interleukin-1 receptor domain-containing protein [Cupriavidus gilardii]MCG5260484.1 toll/interleukin-1 receptor domain-containing protein [Cupriavidus gilardii]MDF9428333.1 toll/interleukin-1 receptor domain-containing protein [Cupriavidus gilardii]
MARVFVSYSHADESYRAELDKHLSLLQKQGLVELWHDHRIPPGGELESHISAELEAADLILLLVSADFMASDYCYGIEMTRAMERHATGTAVVVPLIIRPCDWHSAPFGRLKALPRDAKAVSKWPSLDDAFLDVVQALRSLVTPRRSGLTGVATPPRMPLPDNAPVTAARPRSSMLALRKEFNDIDRERFVEEGFAYIRAFFENSMEELAPRNPGYEGRFRAISNEAFTGALYRNGKKVAGCYVRISRPYGERAQIGYSGNDNAQDNSYNEMLSVEADDQSMYFRQLMQSWSGRETKLTPAGAAEALWQLFLERAQ